MGVAIPFTDWFGPMDRKQLDKVEDTIERVVASRALLVLVVTTPEMREHVFYSDRPEWIGSFHQELQRALPDHRVDVMAEADPEWAVYAAFAR